MISSDHHHSTRSTAQPRTTTPATTPHSTPTSMPTSSATTRLVNTADTDATNRPTATPTDRNAIRAFRAYACDTGVSITVISLGDPAPNQPLAIATPPLNVLWLLPERLARALVG